MSSNRRLRYIAAPAATFVTLSSAGLVVALAGTAQAAEAVPTAAGVQTAAVPAAAAASTAPVTVVIVPAPPAPAASVVAPAVVPPAHAAVAPAPAAVVPVPVPAAVAPAPPAVPPAAAPATSAPIASVAAAAAAAPAHAATPPTAAAPASAPPAAQVAPPVVAPMVSHPLATTAPAPSILGTAASFGVLAGSGITNVGVTTIHGDVGSHPTASETGFSKCPLSPPAVGCVTIVAPGANHTSGTDAVTTKAINDLTTAYNAIGLLTGGSTIGSELGGQSLTAGIYDAAGGFQITGTLTLAGPGVFIFRTPTQLSTSVGSNVVLTGGALACNVYFQAGLDATSANLLGNIKGTVLAYNTITVGSGVTVTGRLLAGAQAGHTPGAVTLIHDTINSPGSCAATPPGAPTLPTGTTPTGTTPTGTTPTGTTPTGTTPTGTTTTGGTGSPSGTTRTPIGASATPTGLTGVPVSFVVHSSTGSRTINGVLVSGSTTPTGAGTGTDTTTGTTPQSGTELTATPTGAQVGQVPVGGVHAGDGSSLAGATTGTRTTATTADPLLLEALALAGIAGTAGVVARLRRRRS